MLSRISENNEYIDELWKSFSSRDDQATILGSIAKLPEFFGLKFSERVKKSLSIQQENVKYMGGCILVGIAVVAGLSFLIQSDSGWLLYAVIGLGSFLLITVAYLWVKEIGNLIARRIFLRTHNTPAHQQSAGQGWKRFLAPAAIAAMLAAAAIIFFYGQ